MEKVFIKNKDGMNVQQPQTIKDSGLSGYVLLYNGYQWKRKHTNTLPQEDLFIFIGEMDEKILKIGFIN